MRKALYCSPKMMCIQNSKDWEIISVLKQARLIIMLALKQRADILLPGLLLEVSVDKRSEICILLGCWKPVARLGWSHRPPRCFSTLGNGPGQAACSLTAQTDETLARSECLVLDTEQKLLLQAGWNRLQWPLHPVLQITAVPYLKDGISSWQVAVCIAGLRNAGDNPLACFSIKQSPFSMSNSWPRIQSPQGLSTWYSWGRQDFEQGVCVRDPDPSLSLGRPGQACACDPGACCTGRHICTNLSSVYFAQAYTKLSPGACIDLLSAFRGSSLQDPPQLFLSSTHGNLRVLLQEPAPIFAISGMCWAF